MKKIMCFFMVVILLLANNTISEAAGKKAIGLKNNKYSGTSDARAFVNGIKSKDSGYAITYKELSNVTKSDFY